MARRLLHPPETTRRCLSELLIQRRPDFGWSAARPTVRLEDIAHVLEEDDSPPLPAIGFDESAAAEDTAPQLAT